MPRRFHRKKSYLLLKLLIEEIKEEFNVWTKGRKFAPTIML
jgi:glutamyl-tRNA reductase